MNRTHQLITSSTLLQELEEHIPKCSHLIVISAYLTSPAVKRLIDIAPCDLTAVVVGKFSPNDFTMGASDIAALRSVLSANWDLRVLDDLHAKIYQLDENTMYLGSANCTANGLNLYGTGNVEAVAKLHVTAESSDFVQRIVDSSKTVTSAALDRMEEHLQEMQVEKSKEQAKAWPDTIFETPGLYVADFPLNPPEGDGSGQREGKSQLMELQERHEFRSSKGYKWLLSSLYEAEESSLRFGYLTHKLHNDLYDDPSPYRRTVKDLLSNVLEHAGLHCKDVILITKYARSESVSLIARI